jgi:hypothetical protein
MNAVYGGGQADLTTPLNGTEYFLKDVAERKSHTAMQAVWLRQYLDRITQRAAIRAQRRTR